MMRRDPFERLLKVYDYIRIRAKVEQAKDFFILDVHDEELLVKIWLGVYKDVSKALDIPIGQITASFSHLVKLESIRSVNQGIWQIGNRPTRELWDSIQSRDLASGKFRPNGKLERALDSNHRLRNDLESLEARVARLEYLVYQNYATRDSSGSDGG